MEITNIRGHRIRWSMLVARGAIAGIVSALVMLVIAAVTFPIAAAGADGWSFLKVAGTVLLGSGAAEPLGGFELAPVLAGLAVHFTIGVIAGVTYALLVAMCDLEGWTPVALFGLLYGAMLFVWSTVFIDAGLTPTSTQQFPVMVIFAGNMAFGLTAGPLLATWADHADLDQRTDERVPVFEGDEQQSPRLLH